MEDDDEVITP